ncbi:hypothetical protein PCC7418_3846 [Halothece sp. PCC 7418]|nr:hypothetical protein PCC7418_3846 [Halothece sp. PCC 7418]
MRYILNFGSLFFVICWLLINEPRTMNIHRLALSNSQPFIQTVIIVSNTSPINYLVLIGEIDFLNNLWLIR